MAWTLDAKASSTAVSPLGRAEADVSPRALRVQLEASYPLLLLRPVVPPSLDDARAHHQAETLLFDLKMSEALTTSRKFFARVDDERLDLQLETPADRNAAHFFRLHAQVPTERDQRTR